MEQKQAYPESWREIRDALARDLENALGLPPSDPEELARVAMQREPGLDGKRLLHVLRNDLEPGSANEFIRAVAELDRLRNEFFHERNDRESLRRRPA